MEDKERLTIVLKHLIEHNEGHEEDYKRWVELAKNAGMDNVAALIEDAGNHVQQTSGSLRRALTLIKQ